MAKIEKFISSIIIILIYRVIYVHSGATILTDYNFNQTLASTDFLVINFYANWCKYSRQLLPIYDTVADMIMQKIHGKYDVKIAKIDLSRETKTQQAFGYYQFPIVKIFKKGEMIFGEYEGRRTADSLYRYIIYHLNDPVHVFQSIFEIESTPSDKPIVIGNYEKRNSPDYNYFEKIAKRFRHLFNFRVVFGPNNSRRLENGKQTSIACKDSTNGQDKVFHGDNKNFSDISSWLQNDCKINNITPENITVANELNEIISNFSSNESVNLNQTNEFSNENTF